MYCTQCGSEVAVGDKYCADCGNALALSNERVHRDVEGEGELRTDSASWSIQPHPWLRYFARGVDLAWYSVILGAIVCAVAPESINALAASRYDAFWSIGVIWAWCLVEPIFLSSAGTTPGKWLFGLSLQTRGQWAPSYTTYFERTVRVFVIGMWLVIPLLYLIPVFMSYRRLVATGRTAWDEYLDIDVRHRRPSIMKRVLAVVAFLSVVATLYLIAALRIDA